MHTNLNEHLNPTGCYPLERSKARIEVLIAIINYLKKGIDFNLFMNKTIAHVN